VTLKSNKETSFTDTLWYELLRKRQGLAIYQHSVHSCKQWHKKCDLHISTIHQHNCVKSNVG